MSKKIFRKPKPSPPHWFYWDTDNCWDCNCNHNGCSSCKRLKKFKKKKYEPRNESKRILRKYQK